MLIQDYLDICDPVLTFDRFMGGIDLEKYLKNIQKHYTGRLRYNPVSMLKTVLFGFMTNGYISLRELEDQCRVNLRFMYLIFVCLKVILFRKIFSNRSAVTGGVSAFWRQMVLVMIQPHIIPCCLPADIVLFSCIIFGDLAVIYPAADVQTRCSLVYFMVSLLSMQG